jgi:hypothetical protein
VLLSLWPNYIGEKGRTLGKNIWGLKRGAIGNTLGEHIGNLKGTLKPIVKGILPINPT